MLLINTLGIVLMLLIAWWFWFYPKKETRVEAGVLDIMVKDGVYTPSVINAHAGQSLTLNFMRNDSSPCSELVLFPDLEITETLPMDKSTQIVLPNLKSGIYKFHCQMQMYKGELHIE